MGTSVQTVQHKAPIMASSSWVLEDVSEFVDDKKRGVICMACDEELIVVGLSGWSGTARVYDINTGELKFKLQCNKLGDTPAPFSHDNILVWLGTSIIVTVGMNDNTFSIWDREGNLLAQDLHKDQELIALKAKIEAMDHDEREEWLKEKTSGMSEIETHEFVMKIAYGNNKKNLHSLNVIDDKIYCGYNGGFLIIENSNGQWEITKKVELNEQIIEIDFAGNFIAIAFKEDGKTTFKFWDPLTEDFTEALGLKVKRFSAMKIVFPHMFIVGGRRGNNTGVEIWNVETGEMVRHLLKDEKEYECIAVNEKFLAVCEQVNSWTSGEEHNLKLAVYNTEQVVDQEMTEESLWRQNLEYSVKNLGGEHVSAALNKDCLVVNHSKTIFSVKKIVEQ